MVRNLIGRSFVLLFKTLDALGPVGDLVIDRFFHDNTLFRDGVTDCIRLASFLIYFVDIGLKIRGGLFLQLFRCTASLRGIVLFGLPAGNVRNLAGGLIFQRQAVAGHGLCHAQENKADKQNAVQPKIPQLDCFCV